VTTKFQLNSSPKCIQTPTIGRKYRENKQQKLRERERERERVKIANEQK
jgi:ribosomal protein S30